MESKIGHMYDLDLNFCIAYLEQHNKFSSKLKKNHCKQQLFRVASELKKETIWTFGKSPESTESWSRYYLSNQILIKPDVCLVVDEKKINKYISVFKVLINGVDAYLYETALRYAKEIK